ncbi:hypothetical protein GALMADRAFT_250309 [Galerina marginata CBS 339.88]|uniref:Uncharacterized protein n=1 Tax=Galerina marginata (strain CBS 339.88) TaxID=685588 RepID=A0A067SWG8_GALM3|nr:hypothetical protein GALMADRAFT_250309 [Galerina marginata CBS 339.88]
MTTLALSGTTVKCIILPWLSVPPCFFSSITINLFFHRRLSEAWLVGVDLNNTLNPSQNDMSPPNSDAITATSSEWWTCRFNATAESSVISSTFDYHLA